MSMSTMGESGEILVPTPGGAVNLGILERLAFLEKKVAELEQNAVTVTDATDVTEIDGKAASARQLNSTIEGTIANQIVLVDKKISGFIKKRIINVPHAAITTKSAGGAFYGAIKNFCASNGIDADKVICTQVGNFAGASNIFSACIQNDGDLLLMSAESQIVNQAVLLISYFN